MRLSTVLGIIVSLVFAGGALAAEPADDVIRNARIDLEKYQAQAAGLTPGRAANANRILKLMDLSRERLATSSHREDPSWKETDQAYAALDAQLRTLLDPDTDGQDATGVSPESAETAPAAASMAPAQQASAPGDAPALVSGQRVQVKKLARDMASLRAGIVTSGPSELQDPGIVAARQKSMQQFADALGRYPQLDDPDVQAARAEYEALREALSAEFERARDQLAQLGDVQQALATIEANQATYPVPDALNPPFSPDAATAWVDAAGKARTVAEHNLEQLAIIAPLAWLPNNPGTPQTGAPYDANDVARLQAGAGDSLRRIGEHVEQMSGELDRQMTAAERSLDVRWQEDPTAPDKRYLFLADGQREEAMEFYGGIVDTARSAISLDQALGRDNPRAEALLGRAEEASEAFLANRSLALERSRLPEPKSRDDEREDIARAILENPQYAFGEHGPIVLTTKDIVEREREDSEIEIDDAELTAGGDLKMSGTETTWTYRWKEFKFAVPLRNPDDDSWNIWWITARNYSSGGPRTPLERWVSGEATEGDLILPENF